MPSTKNILIFVGIAVVALGGAYYFYSQSSESSSLLSSATPSPTTSSSGTTGGGNTGEFLNLLLNVRSIKLDDSIFDDLAFKSLDGSNSILLIPDGSEGRPNPFAPIGSETTPVTGTPTTPASPHNP